jgi:hypothetical protein
MYAKRESTTLGNVGETLIAWALLQLQKACSTEKLLRRPVPVPRNPNGSYGLPLREKSL